MNWLIQLWGWLRMLEIHRIQSRNDHGLAGTPRAGITLGVSEFREGLSHLLKAFN